MPTPKRGPRLGSGPAHQKHLLAGLASDLFRHGRITTTEAKAKALRPYAERLITKGKRGDLHARRQVLAKLHDRDVVAYLFEDVAPRFADRNGGYTRIVKLGPRRGDNAPMAIIELVEQGREAGAEAIEESKRGRSRGLFGRRRRREVQPVPAGAPLMADEPEVEEAFDVEDDEQVARAIAEATGAAPEADAADEPEASDEPDASGGPEGDAADEPAPDEDED